MTEGPPVLPGDSLPDVPLSPSSSQHSTATPHTPEQHGHHHLLLLLLLSPEQLAVPGDVTAVEFVPAGWEVGGVDDQHLPSRTGEQQLSAVTSWLHHKHYVTFVTSWYHHESPCDFVTPWLHHKQSLCDTLIPSWITMFSKLLKVMYRFIHLTFKISVDAFIYLDNDSSVIWFTSIVNVFGLIWLFNNFIIT